MLHRLTTERKIQGPIALRSGLRGSKSRLVEIPAGRATLGLSQKTGDEFGWDNEQEAHTVEVAGFAIDSGNVTNHDYLRFIQAEGYENRALWSDEAWAWKEKEGVQNPAMWRRDGGVGISRAMFGDC